MTDTPEPTAELVAVPVASDALVRPAAATADIVTAFLDYQELRNALLDPTDFQQIGDKKFAKKSAWRKLAVAFGVSTSIEDRRYARDDDGRIIRAEFVVKATAPNGRTEIGIGICDRSERKFSKPEHDIPAIAHTRAKNRACSDLFGFGEVSAEEVTDIDTADAEYAEIVDTPDVTGRLSPAQQRLEDIRKNRPGGNTQ